MCLTRSGVPLADISEVKLIVREVGRACCDVSLPAANGDLVSPRHGRVFHLADVWGAVERGQSVQENDPKGHEGRTRVGREGCALSHAGRLCCAGQEERHVGPASNVARTRTEARTRACGAASWRWFVMLTTAPVAPLPRASAALRRGWTTHVGSHRQTKGRQE